MERAEARNLLEEQLAGRAREEAPARRGVARHLSQPLLDLKNKLRAMQVLSAHIDVRLPGKGN